MVINQAIRNTNVHSSARVLGDTFVVSEKFISNCLKFFDEAMQHKAQKVEKLIKNENSFVQADSICVWDFFFFTFAGRQKQSSIFDQRRRSEACIHAK